MPFQPGSNVYTQGFGSAPENVEVPHIDSRAPTANDVVFFPIGKRWIDQVGLAEYTLVNLTTITGVVQAVWISAAISGSAILGTTNQITSTVSLGVATLSTPVTFIAPGSIASTSTLTGGTGITATAGNITAPAGAISAFTTVTGGTGVIATTGNVTSSAGNLVATLGNLSLPNAASGLVLTPTVVSGAASGTVAGNGRVVSITFTGVSIASGATQAFTTSNTSITGSGTVLALSWSGVTTGAALSVQSIANTASQSVITMTNGTSATMVTSVANLTFTYFVLN